MDVVVSVVKRDTKEGIRLLRLAESTDRKLFQINHGEYYRWYREQH